MRIAVYPGSFDPPTLGHLDLVARTAGLFDKIVVVVGVNARKTPTFTPEERVVLFRESLEHLGVQGVEVACWGGLIVDFARQAGARFILRGLRQGGDFEAEQAIGLMNRRLAPEIESVYLASREEHLGLNSTIVRQIAALGGDVSSFVTPPVAAALAAKSRT